MSTGITISPFPQGETYTTNDEAAIHPFLGMIVSDTSPTPPAEYFIYATEVGDGYYTGISQLPTNPVPTPTPIVVSYWGAYSSLDQVTQALNAISYTPGVPSGGAAFQDNTLTISVTSTATDADSTLTSGRDDNIVVRDYHIPKSVVTNPIGSVGLTGPIPGEGIQIQQFPVDQGIVSTNESPIHPWSGSHVVDTSATAATEYGITVTYNGHGTLAGNGGLMYNGTRAGDSPPGVVAYTELAKSVDEVNADLAAIIFTPDRLHDGQTTASIPMTLLVSSNLGQTPAYQSISATVNDTPTPTPVPTPTPTPTPPVQLPHDGPATAPFVVFDEVTGVADMAEMGEAYIGPVSGITSDLINITSHNLLIWAYQPNVFIHSGSGDDAIDISKGGGGTNVVDGSTGSNFITGGPGSDTFYLDDRSPAQDVFSTIAGFHAGDNASVFGVNASDFQLNELDGQGAAGYLGLDFGFSAPGHANANIVLSGYTTADLTNGRLSVVYGTTSDGTQYMNVHAN